MVSELIRYIITTLVDRPEAVTIATRQQEGKVLLEIQVAAHDRAKVIGKEGRTLKALRALANAVHSEGQVEITLEQDQPLAS